MKLRTLTCLLLVLTLLFTAGCGSAVPDDTESTASGGTTPARAQTMNLLCCGNDTLNPYTAITKTNQELAGLLFDPLVKLDRAFQPVYVIAESAEVTKKVCTVTLKSASFTDGAPVSAADVVASFTAAKVSARYAAQLEEVLSATAVGNTVRFTLSKNDPYAANLLDFPIFKKGSDQRVNGDNVALPPIGCGRYTIDDAKTVLTANPDYHGGNVNIGTIYLTDTPDGESIAHNVEVGGTDLYYTDISDGRIIRMSAKRADVPLNHLVYIGINLKNTRLQNPYLRYAISSAINREAIVKTAYFENATPAEGPFPAVWEDAKGYQTLQSAANTEITLVNLEKIGYNRKDSEGYWIDAAGKRLTLRLLVNTENQSRQTAASMIVSQLAEVGIAVTLESHSFATYQAMLEGGNFDLYLAEVKILSNMDLTPLVTAGGSAAYGVTDETSSTPDATQSAPESDTSEPNNTSSDGVDSDEGDRPVYTAASTAAGFYAGQNTLGDVITAFLSEMPLIPVCHRNGILFYDTDLEPAPPASASDIFFSIEALTRK